MPLFDWRYIKHCQIGIEQLSGCVIPNLRYHFNVSRMKWSRRGVNPNLSVLWKNKFSIPNFPQEKSHLFRKHFCYSTSFFPVISCHNYKLCARFQFASCAIAKRWCIREPVNINRNGLKRYLICGWLYRFQHDKFKKIIFLNILETTTKSKP